MNGKKRGQGVLQRRRGVLQWGEGECNDREGSVTVVCVCVCVCVMRWNMHNR